MNFGDRISVAFGSRSEAELHPHVKEERGHLFRAVDGGAAELETLNFLNALVYLLKPGLALETGTGSGLSTGAIASAMKLNGFGHVHSVEIDRATRVQAAQNIARLDTGLVDYVTLHEADSRQFVSEWTGEPFEFAFFDSLIAFRHEEFRGLLDWGLLAPGATCVFHDTSRRRGEYFHDFNPEMIAALDRECKGRQNLEFSLSRGLRVIRLA